VSAPRLPTPHHTTGPFFPGGFIAPGENRLGPAAGSTSTLGGRVLDGCGRPAVNVIVELWLPDGRWARTWTDGDGHYHFRASMPEASDSGTDPAWRRPPFFRLLLLGSGIMRPLVTEVFFPDEPLNEHDRQLAAVAPERRHRLVAAAESSASSDPGGRDYRFDIILQGPDETPFYEDRS